MKIAVIIPVYNSSAMLAGALKALRLSERMPDEVIVVDDGSDDDSAAVAAEYGATVISMQQNSGPATCRNHAALKATSDVLVFLDADTCVHRDTLQRMEAYLEQDKELGAVIGAYDDEPSDPGLCSQFRNLAHCYVHRSSKRDALTFWSGCGAVRRALFLAVDGFDQRYRKPSVEDIEFGYRLSDRGIRIHLDPDICVTHAKQWSLWNSIVTDVIDRGMPWMVLLIKRRKAPNDLNIRRRHRIAIVLSGAGIVCLFGSMHSLYWVWLAVGLMLLGLCMDVGLLRFIYRKRGTELLLVASLLTLLHNFCKLAALFGGIFIYTYRLLPSVQRRRGQRRSEVHIWRRLSDEQRESERMSHEPGWAKDV